MSIPIGSNLTFIMVNLLPFKKYSKAAQYNFSSLFSVFWFLLANQVQFHSLGSEWILSPKIFNIERRRNRGWNIKFGSSEHKVAGDLLIF